MPFTNTNFQLINNWMTIEGNTNFSSAKLINFYTYHWIQLQTVYLTLFKSLIAFLRWLYQTFPLIQPRCSIDSVLNFRLTSISNCNIETCQIKFLFKYSRSSIATDHRPLYSSRFAFFFFLQTFTFTTTRVLHIHIYIFLFSISPSIWLVLQLHVRLHICLAYVIINFSLVFHGSARTSHTFVPLEFSMVL